MKNEFLPAFANSPQTLILFRFNEQESVVFMRFLSKSAVVFDLATGQPSAALNCRAVPVPPIRNGLLLM